MSDPCARTAPVAMRAHLEMATTHTNTQSHTDAHCCMRRMPMSPALSHDAGTPADAACAARGSPHAEHGGLGAWLDASGAPLTAVTRGGTWKDYRLARLERVRVRLARLAHTPEAMAAWWTTPVLALGGVTPRDLLGQGAIGALFVALRQAEGATRRGAAERHMPAHTRRQRCHPRSNASAPNADGSLSGREDPWPGADDFSEEAWLEQ